MIYFDVTDIIQYAKGNSRVSGIQRVQAKILSELAKSEKHDKDIRCVYLNDDGASFVSFRASDIFDDYEFNSNKMLGRLGMIQRSKFPPRNEIRKFLQPFSQNKLKRALKKVEVYARAVFAPRSLVEMGLQSTESLEIDRLVKKTTLKSLPAEATYVLLGANWNIPKLADTALAHRASGGQVVQMVYDLIPHVRPIYFNSDISEAFERFLISSIGYASKYACISKWTERDLREFLTTHQCSAPSTTVPLAHELDGFSRNETQTPPSNPELQRFAGTDFVLCVGTIEVRKNGLSLLKAWRVLHGQRGQKTPKLVFAGKVGWKISEFFDFLDAHPELRPFVEIVNSPSDKDLAFLYQHCTFTVYPSFYEGWGLPVGEAAWFGKYCVASRETSLPEVCGDLIDYIDPSNIDEIAAQVGRIFDNRELLANKELAIRNAPLRDWRKVALDLYGELTASNVVPYRPGNATTEQSASSLDSNTASSQRARHHHV